MWFFVHIGFLNGFGNKLSTMFRWFRTMVGRARPERVFSVGHTGGDLSLPDDVKAKVMPNAFPVQADAAGWAALVAKAQSTDPPTRGSELEPRRPRGASPGWPLHCAR